jgi:hypothetical protein
MKASWQTMTLLEEMISLRSSDSESKAQLAGLMAKTRKVKDPVTRKLFNENVLRISDRNEGSVNIVTIARVLKGAP